MEDKMAHKHQNQKGISAALVRAECTASVSFNVPNIQEHYETTEMMRLFIFATDRDS